MNTNKTWALYERRYGTLYEDTKHLSVKEIAAHMRKVIRQAAKDGVLPKNWNYQVRYRAYAGGCAIDVNFGKRFGFRSVSPWPIRIQSPRVESATILISTIGMNVEFFRPMQGRGHPIGSFKSKFCCNLTG